MIPFIQQLSIGCGFKAKALCNGVFVSGFPPPRVVREDVGFNPLFRLIASRIDRERRGVACSILGLGWLEKTAIQVDGVGAVLLSGEDRANVVSLSRPPALAPEAASVPWPNGDLLPTDQPHDGFDLGRIAAAAAPLFEDHRRGKKLRTRALLVLHDGRLVLERYGPGITKDTRLPSWSMAKGVTSLLVGILVGKGKVSISAPASVPEWSAPDDPRRAITLDQLLRMSSGLTWYEAYAEHPVSDVNAMLFLEPDMAGYAARKPLAAPPDTVWNYSSGTANIICRIIRHSLGSREQYAAFPRTELFDRIGMHSALFGTDATGTFIGSSYLFATARDFARLGLLCLDDGVWQGKRVLPEGWMSYATTPTPQAPKGEYGALFWLNHGPRGDPAARVYPRLPRDAYFALGYQGQTIAVVPSHRLVVVRLGMTYDSDWGIENFLAGVIEAVR